MKRHNVILESNVEPKDNNVLWLQGNKLKKFGNTGWEDIIEGSVVTTDRIENGAVTTDKIATNAFDSTLSKSEKIAPANIVGEKITTLDEKVDALALGKFYGYFPDSTSFPTDVSIPGYAYVRLDNSYKIWNFNGESWSDSGVSIDENDVIITTDRIADGAVTSEKISSSAFDNTLSVSGKIAPADVVGKKITELKEKIVEDSEDSFLFADKNGNVAFSIGADGAKARNYNICDQDGNVIMTINEHFLDNIQVEDIINTQATEDSFLFADKFGRVIAKIDKDGLHSKNYHTSADKNIANAYIHPWCYKQVWAFGDSHCNVDNCNLILGKIQEITGCKVDFVKNANIGVTRSWDINSQIFKKFEYGIGSNEKSLYALKELVDKGEATADVILLEQTHYVFNDDISAEPFNGSQVIEYNTESTHFASEYAMKSALDGSIKTFLTGISADNRKSCSVLKCWYSAVSKTLNFSSASSSLKAGTFTLKLGEATFDVAVTEGMSVPEALTKLNLWQFGDVPECKWVNPAHHTAIMDNNLKVIYRGEDDASNHPISLIDNGTGMTLSSMIDSSAIDFNYFLFMCHAPSKWLDMTKWKYYNRNKEEYGYAIVKGMIELAQRLFPSAEIVMWYPVSLNKDNTKYEDGTFDNYTFTQNNYHWKECVKGVRCWKECAELYNVRFIDVKDNCGMSAINFESWYDAGIHAIPEGYKRWGEILARMF